ncbi:nitrite/sulfite reductase [Hydrogenimonas sp.]
MKEKINKIEKLKRELSPYGYFSKIRMLDAGKLNEADRFYLKNFGIYNHKLDPDEFTVRVRVPAGRISVENLQVLHTHAKSVGAKIILTSRAQLELHGLDFKTALVTVDIIERMGTTSWQTFTDNFRNIVTDPLDGIADGSVFETYNLIMGMQKIFLKNPDFVGTLPRKFNTAISGSRTQNMSFFGNDLFFALAKKNEVYGFNLYAGGKNSETAQSLDIFAKYDEVVSLFHAVANIYRVEGPRHNRSKIRLFHMMERIGIDALRDKIANLNGKKLNRAGELQIHKGENSRMKRLKNGLFAHRYATRFGEPEDRQFKEIFDLCNAHGVQGIRIGCDQNFYIPNLPEEVAFRYSKDIYEGILACAGSKYCVYSLTDTKNAAADIDISKWRDLGITIGFSGCLKGCARHAFSDIGLVGIRTKLFTDKVERGVRLYLGAEYTHGKRVGRLILYSVPMRHLNDMIELVVDLFVQSGFKDFEDFSKEILNRHSEPALAFWLLLNFYRRHIAKRGELIALKSSKEEDEKSYFIHLLESLDEERNIVEHLRQEEEFLFRKAIAYLERICFADAFMVKSRI